MPTCSNRTAEAALLAGLHEPEVKKNSQRNGTPGVKQRHAGTNVEPYDTRGGEQSQVWARRVIKKSSFLGCCSWRIESNRNVGW
jgi:hypothetical protein